MATKRFRTRQNREEDGESQWDEPAERAERLRNYAAQHRVCAECRKVEFNGASMCNSGKCPAEARA
jgi:hypothetical protein